MDLFSCQFTSYNKKNKAGVGAMRRKEFQMEEQEEIVAFLREMSFGFLGMVGEDGFPHVIPLNYVYVDGHVYFHGSKIGEKMQLLASDNRVSFSVAKEYAIIPSYWSNPKLACPATSFFKSVYMQGHAEVLTDLSEKAEALTAFMQKLQPEGGYDPIDPADSDYAKQLSGVSVVKIAISSISAKFKFGQNWKEPRLQTISEELMERGRELDEETAHLMAKYCPHHRT